MIESLWQDLRFGFRMLIKRPGFTSIAVVTLALGIGANTAVFSVVNALILRPLPFREPERLVWISSDRSPDTKSGGSLIASEGNLSAVTTQVGHFYDWSRLNQSCEDLAGYFAFFDYNSYILTGKGEPERLRGIGITQNFLHLLGVGIELGRGFVDEECVWNGRPAMILTHGFWERRFNRDPGIVGQSMSINDKPTLVVGVLPASFDFASVFSPASQIDFLAPFPICPQTDRWGNTLAVVGRLSPGVTIQAAQAEFDSIT